MKYIRVTITVSIASENGDSSVYGKTSTTVPRQDNKFQFPSTAFEKLFNILLWELVGEYYAEVEEAAE